MLSTSFSAVQIVSYLSALLSSLTTVQFCYDYLGISEGHKQAAVSAQGCTAFFFEMQVF